MSDLLRLTTDRLDLEAVAELLADEGSVGRDGAVAIFAGRVRAENLGRHVVELEYEAYEPLARRSFEIISGEVAEFWPKVRLALHHRLGRLAAGEASIVIAAAAPHRSDAFQACRYTIERVKQIAPIWKREVFEGGEAWVEGATADPSDAEAKQTAYRRACG